MSKKWYHNWFNSPYYHILYHQRNDQEAEFFIDNLFALIKPPADCRILDIACGRGRHAVYLNRKGCDVTGIDLSSSNIKFANQFENEKLHFYMHDMRHLLYVNYFDIALNLFTSFGYFNSEREHINALKSFNKSLKRDGLLILDYFNTGKIVRNLVNTERKQIAGINFQISKRIENESIIKTIDFDHKNRNYRYREEVKAYSREDLKKLFFASNFEILHEFGDYSLNDFDQEESDRIIFICKKQNA